MVQKNKKLQYYDSEKNFIIIVIISFTGIM